MKTETPRTEAEVLKNKGKVMSVSSDFSRKLELENNVMREALKKAIEIIKIHVPDDALGINSNCGEPVAQTWPIKDEEIYYMEQALVETPEISAAMPNAGLEVRRDSAASQRKEHENGN